MERTIDKIGKICFLCLAAVVFTVALTLIEG